MLPVRRGRRCEPRDARLRGLITLVPQSPPEPWCRRGLCTLVTAEDHEARPAAGFTLGGDYRGDQTQRGKGVLRDSMQRGNSVPDGYGSS